MLAGDLFYCKKCGRVLWTLTPTGKKCDCCKSEIYPVPEKYVENFRWRDRDGKQALTEELVKTSPEFDQNLFDNRDLILSRQTAEYERAMAHGKAVLEGKDKGNKFGVSCPYCHATNVRKITVTSKAIHTSIFGIFSMGRNAKNYHCDHCGSDF